MNTVGDVIKKARLAKKVSRKSLSVKTRIRQEFIEAIEKGNWGNLPESAVVAGFVKSLATTLGVDEYRVLALLRRDYPKVPVAKPAKEVHSRFVWTPRHTFALGVVAVLVVALSYIGFQYISFVRPPDLSITSPVDGQEIIGTTIEISGTTDKDVTLSANNQPILVADDGSFKGTLNVNPDTQSIEFVAVSRSGKQAVVVKSIRVVR